MLFALTIKKQINDKRSTMKKWMLLIALAIPSLSFAKELNRIHAYEDSYILGSYISDLNKQTYIDGGFEDADGLHDVEVKFKFSFAVPLFPVSQSSSIMFAYIASYKLWLFAYLLLSLQQWLRHLLPLDKAVN